MAGNTYVLLRQPWVRLAGEGYLLFDVGGLVGTAGMAAMLVYKIATHTAQLYRMERLPR
jgi:hypothetical protein